LDDFGITELLTQLGNYSDTDFDIAIAQTNPTQPELESLAAIIIRQLTTNLNGKAITDYLNAMRHGSANIPPSLVHLVFPPPSIDLPANFPNVELLATCMATNSAFFVMMTKPTGELRSADSTASPLITVLGCGATLFGSINSRPVPLVSLRYRLGR
jgi:hypothetical protein